MDRLDTDVLILGAGGAGLFAALHAKKAAPDLDVTVAVKGLLGKCGCTRMVQGGYNVALAPGDSVERHFMDTIEGGQWLNHQDLAWLLVEQAPVRIRELENEIGCFSTATRAATFIRRGSPGRPSVAPSTRAASPASRSSTACPSRCGGAAGGGSGVTARSTLCPPP